MVIAAWDTVIVLPTAYPEPTADIVAFWIEVPGLPTSKLSTIIVAPVPEPFVVVGKAAVAPLVVVVILKREVLML